MEYINGSTGIYDGKINNPSVLYGRNSINNYNKYLQKLVNFDLPRPSISSNLCELSDDEFSQTLTEIKDYNANLDEWLDIPLDYELRYQPESVKRGDVDKLALLGAAYESMDQKFSVSVQEMTKSLQEGSQTSSVKADALYINEDGIIDNSEYAVSILAADMLSTNSSQLNGNNITGIINNQGNNALLFYAAVKNYSAAKEDFKNIYDYFKLNEAQKAFTSQLNNIA